MGPDEAHNSDGMRPTLQRGTFLVLIEPDVRFAGWACVVALGLLRLTDSKMA